MSESNSTKALLGGITALLAVAAGTATYLGTFQKSAPSPELRKLDELVSAGVKEADAARQAALHAGELSAAKAEELRRATRSASSQPAVAAHSTDHAAPPAKPAEAAPAVAPAPAAPAAPAATADLSKLPPAAGAPHVRGIIAIGGTRPAERAIAPLKADANCGKLVSGDVLTRSWVGEGQGLANVFVYIKKGLEGKTFPSPTGKPVIDQKACIYEPMVLGLQTGQTVEIRNSDPVLHNVLFQKSASGNPVFNLAQGPGAKPIEKAFPNPEVLIKLVCSVHPWMAGYVGVLPHPYFAITDAHGVFELPTGLPAGKYTLAAYHVRGGEVTTEITVGDDGAATAGLVIPVK